MISDGAWRDKKMFSKNCWSLSKRWKNVKRKEKKERKKERYKKEKKKEKNAFRVMSWQQRQRNEIPSIFVFWKKVENFWKKELQSYCSLRFFHNKEATQQEISNKNKKTKFLSQYQQSKLELLLPNIRTILEAFNPFC